MLNPEGITIQSEEDIKKITHSSEQQFARVLFTNPNLRITHEPKQFSAEQERIGHDGTVEKVILGHIPDFSIENLANPNAGSIYVEITQHNYDPATDPPEMDPKARKRYVMSQREHPGRYVVLYLPHLERIEKASGVTIIDFSLRERMEAKKLTESPIAS
jgi:hypothetical protein